MRVALRIAIALLLASMLGLALALARAVRLGGEWSAVVMLVDGVVIGYALLMSALGWFLRDALAKRGGSSLTALIVWSLLGPLPVTVFATFHLVKIFR